MKLARCLQHVPFEGPAAFEPVLNELGYRIETQLVPQDGLPPDPGDFLLVMGGPMSANDSDLWIEQEIAFIRRAVDTGTPLLGVCLGCQLLARAVGGEVYKGPAFEIGVTTLTRTETGRQDRCLALFPAQFPAFEWHGEGVRVPDDCAVLAANDLYPVQAFRAGPSAYGLLFHLEVSDAAVEALCLGCEEELIAADSNAGQIRERASARIPDLNALAATFLTTLLRDQP